MIERNVGRIIRWIGAARVGSRWRPIYSGAKGGGGVPKTGAGKSPATGSPSTSCVPGPTDTAAVGRWPTRWGGGPVRRRLIRAIPMRRLGRPGRPLAPAVASSPPMMPPSHRQTLVGRGGSPWRDAPGDAYAARPCGGRCARIENSTGDIRAGDEASRRRPWRPDCRERGRRCASRRGPSRGRAGCELVDGRHGRRASPGRPPSLLRTSAALEHVDTAAVTRSASRKLSLIPCAVMESCCSRRRRPAPSRAVGLQK